LLRLFVVRVPTAAAAELAELQPLRRRLLILRRHVITTLAFRALKHNIIAWHNSPSNFNSSGLYLLDVARLPATRRLQRWCQRRLCAHLPEWQSVSPSPSRSA